MTWLNRLLALVLLLLGLGLVWLGGQLLLEGGSPYYLACALALIAIAGLLWRQSRKALMAYGALWSIHSYGLSGNREFRSGRCLAGWACSPELAFGC